MKSSLSAHKPTFFDTSVLNGLRVLANFIVVHSHVFFYITLILDVPQDVFALRGAHEPFMSFLNLLIFVQVTYAVDIFFFLSGFFFAHSFCQKIPSQYYTLTHAMSHISQRFLRLFPVYAIAWSIATARGSNVSTDLTVLYEMFYILNLHPGFGKQPIISLQSVLVAWSMSADMQAHVFMLLVLVLFKNNRKAMVFLSLATVVQGAMRMKFIANLKHTPYISSTMVDIAGNKEVLANVARVTGMPMGNITITDELTARLPTMIHDQLLEFSPKFRISTAFIGFLTWHIAQQKGNIIRLWIEARPLQSIQASLLTGALTLWCGLMLSNFNRPPTLIDVVFEGFHRVLFISCVAIFVLVIGNPGMAVKYRMVNILRNVLSNGVIHRIAPLSYSIYLLHPFLMQIATNVYPTVTKENITLCRLGVSALQVYAASLLLAVPCHMFETQFSRLVSQRQKKSCSELMQR